MGQSASFPFRLEAGSYTDLGCFIGSTWLMWSTNSSNYISVNRTNTSHSFKINVNITTVSVAGIRHKAEVTISKIIVVGDPCELFLLDPIIPMNCSNTVIEGTVSILHLSESLSEEAKAPKGVFTQLTLLEKFNPMPPASDDFLLLLNNPDTFPDATLKCGNEEILVHKGVLSVRSSVFAAMFKKTMQEGNSGIVEIVDIELNALQATLKYVYSGKTDHLTKAIAGDVLFAADKYELEELKKVCIDKLKSSITVDNVFHVLALGNLHDNSLKNYAMKFLCICDKFSNLEEKEGWKLLQSENPVLAIEVLLFIVKAAQGAEAPNNSLAKLTWLDIFKPSFELSDDFLRLFNNPDTFPDATLKCGNEEILVHKGVLSVRSSVFAAIFKKTMQEGNSGIVEIVDIEPNALQATLKYVYSGKSDHLTTAIAYNVMLAANKFQLEELRKVCIHKIMGCMVGQRASTQPILNQDT